MTAQTSKNSPTFLIGIDIGGTGVKGGIVNLHTGELDSERYRLDTPQPATPEATSVIIDAIVKELISRRPDELTDKPVGVDYPGVVQHGTARSAANVDASWLGLNIQELVSNRINLPVTVINDADAAGLGEATYGEHTNTDGLTMMITLGTGIGSAFIHNGILLPNAELGHIEFHGDDAEIYASAAAREKNYLSWSEYAERLQEYFNYLEKLFSPDRFIVGGGISRRPEDFLPLLHLKTPIITANLKNNAGIVGSALNAAQTFYPKKNHQNKEQ